MLSRRDKLLVQPWEERRFKDHRSKVRGALPAIDVRAPAPRPHVTVKLKKWQRERERTRAVQEDNRSLLQRLAAVMAARRLDNRWEKPLPNFGHKVGLFYDAESLHSRLTARAAHTDRDRDGAGSYYNVKCYACDLKKKQFELELPARGAARGSLPSLSSSGTLSK